MRCTPARELAALCTAGGARVDEGVQVVLRAACFAVPFYAARRDGPLLPAREMDIDEVGKEVTCISKWVDRSQRALL